ncbi:MAG TPA: glucokinase, partial [Cyanobium sp.]|nr:glucokinase [Cyanobium sp.]
MSLLLAGDIGGTKTLLSLHRHCGDGLLLVAQERYVSAAWEGLAPMVLHFLEASQEIITASGGQRPEAACFAVAGPVQGDRARITNLSWGDLSEASLAEACGLVRVELVNDFAVLVYGLPHLGAQQQATIRAGVVEGGAPVLILG